MKLNKFRFSVLPFVVLFANAIPAMAQDEPRLTVVDSIAVIQIALDNQVERDSLSAKATRAWRALAVGDSKLPTSGFTSDTTAWKLLKEGEILVRGKTSFKTAFVSYLYEESPRLEGIQIRAEDHWYYRVEFEFDPESFEIKKVFIQMVSRRPK